MRARIRLPHNRWLNGSLRIKWVDTIGNHKRMSFSIMTNTNKEVSFEIQDKDIYRLADSIVDHVEAFELGKKAQQ